MERLKGDVAIIGAGGAGVLAAVTAAEYGAKVLVFEKRPFPGGNTNLAMGVFGPKIEKIDWAFKEIMEFSHWRANARLVRAFIEKSASLREYLETHGVEISGPPPGIDNNSHFSSMFLLKGRGKGHGGALLVKTMVTRGKEMGVDFRFATPAKKIIKKGDRITGVVVEGKSGEGMQAEVGAVIIASGGYGDNREMIREHAGFNRGDDMFVMKDMRVTGDGIRMAWEVGAAKGPMGMHMIYNVPGPGIVGEVPWMAKNQVRIIQWQPFLWVNKQGKRFFDESIASNSTFTGNAISKQKGRCAYLIFDGSTRKYLEEVGFENLTGVFPGNVKLTDFDEQIKGLLASGNRNVFEADSLKALAEAMGIDPEALHKNVDEYNGFCEKGHDDLFAKDPKYLQPVKDPKFYALRVVPSAYGTLGGIMVNENLEVLDKEQNVIGGLYATGYDASIIYGDIPDYNWNVPGMALGFALNSGRMAGENALKYLGI